MPKATIQPLHPEDIPVLQAAAAADRHGVLYPSDGVWKDGQLVGYASICTTPIVHVWLDSRRVTAIDSVRLLAQLDARLRAQGMSSYLMPCAKTSPFSPCMRRLGFVRLGETVLFDKNLNQG